MSGALDNIHPELDQSSTIDILLRDVSDIESDSDYYMAVSHLVNFPGSVSIQALMFEKKCYVVSFSLKKVSNENI